MFCSNCPRRCNADHSKCVGWCRSDDRINVSSIVLHKGEEPPLSGEKGIVNLFFPSCNMSCVYCQNHQISERGTSGVIMTLDEVCDAIAELLPLSEGNLGFVSPTHYVVQVISIVKELRRRGLHPVIVYNSNGYELPETIKMLEDIVDVWLPDFKYSDDRLAEELSAAPGYSAFALPSLKGMVHQRGVTLQLNERNIAQSGVIVRHLVLPGAMSNSIGVLKLIAEEVTPNLHISLMSQYYPPEGNKRMTTIETQAIRSGNNQSVRQVSALHRTITRREYEEVVDAFHAFGFSKGWIQDFESHRSYRPDFSKRDPFNQIQ